MVDQIYYKVQYPLKKAIDLMKELDNHELKSLKDNLNAHDKEKIINFIESWKNGGREKLMDLITDLRAQQ
ncbi:MAG: hypothetical protein ACLFUK_06850 [Halanaerobium sp.]